MAWIGKAGRGVARLATVGWVRPGTAYNAHTTHTTRHSIRAAGDARRLAAFLWKAGDERRDRTPGKARPRDGHQGCAAAAREAAGHRRAHQAVHRHSPAGWGARRHRRATIWSAGVQRVAKTRAVTPRSLSGAALDGTTSSRLRWPRVWPAIQAYPPVSSEPPARRGPGGSPLS